MKGPKTYQMACPECGSQIRLPLIARTRERSGPLPGNATYDLTVDLTKFHAHLAKAHDIQERPPRGGAASTTPEGDTP
jgi:hypothetical protein